MSIVHRAAPAARGFTLLEVLIAVVVLSVGLLGVAGMQLAGLKFNQSAYQRSQATAAAAELFDRMRANMGGVRGHSYDSIDTGAAVPADPGCIENGCSPSELAQYDIYQWYNALQSRLGSGASGTVVGAGEGSTFVVTVSWSDAADKGTNQALTVRAQL